MEKISKIETVAQFNKERGQKTLNPLVSILDQSLSRPVQETRNVSELYIIFLKDNKCEDLKYGRNFYDYEEGTLLFIAPGQVFGFQGHGRMLQPSGWALCFHPDFIKGTHLGRHMGEYNF